MEHPFANRRQAGSILATFLREYAGRGDVIVLALPRGGVPVAHEVATVLQVPLDVFVVRKLGAPWNREYAIGAIASAGVCVLDDMTIDLLGISPAALEHIIATERRELDRRERRYRAGTAFPELKGKTVILVDDGLATGASMRAAIDAIRAHAPASVVAATPVASREACDVVAAAADRCVCAMLPDPFGGVGVWYEDFAQTTDDEVLALLGRTATTDAAPARSVEAASP